jgi:hypothetical protein
MRTALKGKIMNKINTIAISAAIILTLGISAGAAEVIMSKADYKAAKTDLTAKYKMEKSACSSTTGNAKDICVEEAKGRENVSKAELEQNYSPSEKHRYDVRMATANAVFAVAKEKCDDVTGNTKDVCRAEAKDAHVAAKADAKVAEKTADANTTARNKVDAANANARETKMDARSEASIAKRNAEYVVAKEKCDALTDAAKAACVQDAKIQFGQ